MESPVSAFHALRFRSSDSASRISDGRGGHPYGFMNFVHADPHPRPHVTITVGHDLDLKLVVGRQRSIATEVLIES